MFTTPLVICVGISLIKKTGQNASLHVEDGDTTSFLLHFILRGLNLPVSDDYSRVNLSFCLKAGSLFEICLLGSCDKSLFGVILEGGCVKSLRIVRSIQIDVLLEV